MVGLELGGNEVANGGQWIYCVGAHWRIGTITSGTYSAILNRSIALAQIAPEYAELGTVLEVGWVDGMKRRELATVSPLAAYDTSKSRVRS